MGLLSGGIGLGVGALMGGINKLAGRGTKRRLKGDVKRYRRGQDKYLGLMDQSIGSLEDTARGQMEDVTMDELYGQEVDTLTDEVQQNKAGAQDAISRVSLASDEDAAGKVASAVANLTQGSNKNIQDIVNEYSSRTTDYNIRNQRAGERLLNAITGARSRQFGQFSDLLNKGETRLAQKNQADKQFFIDSMGMGLNAGSLYGQRDSDS